MAQAATLTQQQLQRVLWHSPNIVDTTSATERLFY